MKHSTLSQAKFLLKGKIAFGTSRNFAKKHQLICSCGTYRIYCRHLAQFIHYLYKFQISKPRNVTTEILITYLEFRSNFVKQKTLNADKQSLQAAFGFKLKDVESEITTALTSRTYSKNEIEKIKIRQEPRNRLATELSFFAGLRAHELATLSRLDEQPVSSNRNWPTSLFSGIKETNFYTVVGKGGLIRRICLSNELSERLEKRRLCEPKRVKDRDIFYLQKYDVGFGQSWSQSFSTASKKNFGFSHGAHGLRHTFAQERLKTLLRMRFEYRDSLLIVSAELGHFRPEITQIYLR